MTEDELYAKHDAVIAGLSDERVRELNKVSLALIGDTIQSIEFLDVNEKAVALLDAELSEEEAVFLHDLVVSQYTREIIEEALT